MRLLIIRHAEPDYAHNCLTPSGEEEAAALARCIENYHIDDCYTSPMGRALLTAKPCLETLGKRAGTLDWLREFSYPFKRPDDMPCNTICWDWLPRCWADEPAYAQEDAWLETPLFASSVIPEKYRWVSGELDRLLASYGYRREGHLYRAEASNHKTVALFCHFGVESVLLGHLLNIPPMLLWHGTCAAPSSVTSLYTEEREEGYAYWRMNAFGEVPHLAREGRAPSFYARFRETYGDVEPDEP